MFFEEEVISDIVNKKLCKNIQKHKKLDQKKCAEFFSKRTAHVLKPNFCVFEYFSIIFYLRHQKFPPLQKTFSDWMVLSKLKIRITKKNLFFILNPQIRPSTWWIHCTVGIMSFDNQANLPGKKLRWENQILHFYFQNIFLKIIAKETAWSKHHLQLFASNS